MLRAKKSHVYPSREVDIKRSPNQYETSKEGITLKSVFPRLLNVSTPLQEDFSKNERKNYRARAGCEWEPAWGI